MRAPRRENVDGPDPIRPGPDRTSTPLPGSFGLTLDPTTKSWQEGAVLMGGSPLRLLRLSAPARARTRRWENGDTVGERPANGRLARRLVSSGVYLPRPGGGVFSLSDVTVVIPVRDRAAHLHRLLVSLSGLACIVVDDASADPERTEGMAREAGAIFIGLTCNGGPSVARNRGLTAADTALVAFVDSDCVPPEGWLPPLLGHFADPMVAAVAPRIVPVPIERPDALSRYETTRSALDRGTAPGLVRPLSRIPYVPSATLVVRRAAVPDTLFDPALRGGEDVDLVWRLVEAGWDVRYEPDSTVGHDGPVRISSWLGRHAFYGTTAGPLARRHPEALVPLQASAWSALVWALLAARRPVLAAGTLAASVLILARRLHGLVEQPVTVATQIADVGTVRSALPALSGLFRAWSPALALGLGWGRSRRAAALALVAPALADWVAERRKLDPARFVALHIADDLAYGVGVWIGCLQARTVVPLWPRITLRSRLWSSRSLRPA